MATPVDRPALPLAQDASLTWEQRARALSEMFNPNPAPPPDPPQAAPQIRAARPAPSAPPKAWTKVVVAGDFHLPFHHVKAVKAWLQYLKDTGADVVVLNGDVLDCYALSSFSKEPGGPALKHELEVARAFLREVREAVGPQTEIIFMEGNHEHRLQRRLMEQPGLHGLPELHLGSLLGLNQINARHMAYGEVWSRGALCVRHGDRVSAASAATARGELDRGGFDHIIIGHVHRVGWFHKRGALRHQQALENGGFFDRAQCEYEANPNWQNGFCVAMVEEEGARRVHMQPVHVCEDDGSFWWGGQRWG